MVEHVSSAPTALLNHIRLRQSLGKAALTARRDGAGQLLGQLHGTSNLILGGRRTDAHDVWLSM